MLRVAGEQVNMSEGFAGTQIPFCGFQAGMFYMGEKINPATSPFQQMVHQRDHGVGPVAVKHTEALLCCIVKQCDDLVRNGAQSVHQQGIGGEPAEAVDEQNVEIIFLQSPENGLIVTVKKADVAQLASVFPGRFPDGGEPFVEGEYTGRQ